MFQWLTVFLGIAAIVSLFVGSAEIAEFNESCTAAGIPLAECYYGNLRGIR